MIIRRLVCAVALSAVVPLHACADAKLAGGLQANDVIGYVARTDATESGAKITAKLIAEEYDALVVEGAFAHVSESGEVVFGAPEVPSGTPISVAYHYSVGEYAEFCEKAKPTIDNEKSYLYPVILTSPVSDGNERNVVISGRPEFARWLNSELDGEIEEGDAVAEWVYVTELVNIEGICQSVDSVITEYDISFMPGWNIVRRTILDAALDDEGGPFMRSVRYDSLEQMPDTLRWYLLNVPDWDAIGD